MVIEITKGLSNIGFRENISWSMTLIYLEINVIQRSRDKIFFEPNLICSSCGAGCAENGNGHSKWNNDELPKLSV